MNKLQIARLIGFFIFWLLLTGLPLFNEMHYLIFYYIIAGLLLFVGSYWIIQEAKIEEGFYRRWHRLRDKGFLYNFIRGTIFSFIYITIIVYFGQLFGNGRTARELIPLLGDKIFWIILLMLGFSLIIGIVLWFENEKRYNKMSIHKYK